MTSSHCIFMTSIKLFLYGHVCTERIRYDSKYKPMTVVEAEITISILNIIPFIVNVVFIIINVIIIRNVTFYSLHLHNQTPSVEEILSVMITEEQGKRPVIFSFFPFLFFSLSLLLVT